MIKDQEYLKSKASYCLDIAKKNGATDASVMIGHSISETVNFRNKNLDESNRSDDLAFSINTYIGCLLYTSPSPRDRTRSRMPSSA